MLLADMQGMVPLPWLAAPLADALARQRGHALLVQAAPGIGALPFALTLAQGWLCEANSGPLPCGACASCRLLQARMHPDLRLLVPEVQRQALGWPLPEDKPEGEGDSATRRKPSRQIRIEEVRASIDWIVTTSSRSRAKVLVLHPAEALNVQAANALLKTLEEPPAGARLLLTAADPQALLPTVRSRCQHLVLAAPSAAESKRWLEARDVADAGILLQAASGRPLDALALAQDGIDGAAWAALPDAVARGQGAALSGWPVPRAVDALLKLCHDAMACAVTAQPRYFPAERVPAACSLPALRAWERELQRVARHDDHPWNEGLLLESLVAQGSVALRAASGDTLVT